MSSEAKMGGGMRGGNDYNTDFCKIETNVDKFTLFVWYGFSFH